MFNNNSGNGIDWAPGGEYGTVRYGTDANLNVTFYKRAVLNNIKSQEAGMPIHEDKDFIRIMQPGEQLNVIDRPATREDQNRFPMQWANYVANAIQVPEGTPIDLLFPNNPAAAANLKTFGIMTIQQCSQMTDHAMSTVGMGGLDYKLKATRYLESAKNGKEFHEVQKELEALKAKLAEQSFVISEQNKEITDLRKRVEQPGLYSKTQPVVNNMPDIQAERINANHVTAEIAKNVK